MVDNKTLINSIITDFCSCIRPFTGSRCKIHALGFVFSDFINDLSLNIYCIQALRYVLETYQISFCICTQLAWHASLMSFSTNCPVHKYPLLVYGEGKYIINHEAINYYNRCHNA